MKRAHDCTDRELLIRIDERTQHLPKTVARHDKELLIGKVLFVVLLVIAASRYSWIAEVLAKMVG